MAGPGICSIASIDCSHPIHVGSIKANKQIVLGTVTTTVNYTDGNGGQKPSLLQIASTGVTGLYAVLKDPGGYVSQNNGTFQFEITGKANGVGLASFTFTICGKQCTFVRAVEPDLADCDGCLPGPEACEPDVIPQTLDTCLVYNGVSHPCLDIEPGMKLNEVLIKLVNQIQCNP